MREAIGPYRIVEKLGEGGMGIVYAAHDERLDRSVAIKMIHPEAVEGARERLWREARAAASVNHPNICQVYEVGDTDGELYLAMEFLEGVPLAERLASGPLPLSESLEITLAILGALTALHRRSFVHRDLKPSNVFLTPHGVKILDFGLARQLDSEVAKTNLQLTMPGALVGTPRYMAPEQWAGKPASPASDLFAVGALLFEVVAGRPAFAGETLVEVYHAVVYEQPPALTGELGVVAVDRVIRRALAKRPEDRYPDAEAMARDVRTALASLDDSATPHVRATTRFIALPFRVLRPDAEIDFLSFSLPDAVTSSLAGLESLTVRSSLAAARFAGENPDVKRIASEAEVDVVLLGSLLCSGDQVRVSAQLVEAPSGTLVWSKTSQVSLGDVFQLQDELARQIVESLSVPLSARERHQLGRDVPASARAYEFYLRANELARNRSTLDLARDLYRSCLEDDPRFAPAWARLGRVYRMMAKYGGADWQANLRQAQEAFAKALDLNPDLPVAHNLYTYFEIEELGRPIEAMVRLVELARTRGADPELYAGLVLACRFCGLLEASIAADERARSLDPNIRTSIAYTHFFQGAYERLTGRSESDVRFLHLLALALVGREAEAIAGLEELESHVSSEADRLAMAMIAARGALQGKREECIEAWRTIVVAAQAALQGKHGECIEAWRAMAAMAGGFHDPEGLYFGMRVMAFIGETDAAVGVLERVVEGGFYCPTALARDPWLDPVRADPRFVRLLRRAEDRHRQAAEAFSRAGGERLLGVSAR